jgi:hypothetical protein
MYRFGCDMLDVTVGPTYAGLGRPDRHIEFGGGGGGIIYDILKIESILLVAYLMTWSLFHIV